MQKLPPSPDHSSSLFLLQTRNVLKIPRDALFRQNWSASPNNLIFSSITFFNLFVNSSTFPLGLHQIFSPVLTTIKRRKNISDAVNAAMPFYMLFCFREGIIDLLVPTAGLIDINHDSSTVANISSMVIHTYMYEVSLNKKEKIYKEQILEGKIILSLEKI
ncbi:hypothetical protein V1478_010734 [Vespula squamosa]|uniref:Uncharacterized protein n=1 Tax=Vespula squamosa TaxID=30214 RepID=A0ABD2AG50_VESSQ